MLNHKILRYLSILLIISLVVMINKMRHVYKKVESKCSSDEVIYLNIWNEAQTNVSYENDIIKQVLDTHSDIICNEEILFTDEIQKMQMNWKTREKVLKEAGISLETVNLALKAFSIEFYRKNNKQAKIICANEKKSQRKKKLILFVRDLRSSLYSFKRTMPQFNKETSLNNENYENLLVKWNRNVEKTLGICQKLGDEFCMTIHYNQLILRPKKTLITLFNFLNIPFENENLFMQKIASSSLTSDQKSINAWFDQIPQDLVEKFDSLAPIIKKLYK